MHWVLAMVAWDLTRSILHCQQSLGSRGEYETGSEGFAGNRDPNARGLPQEEVVKDEYLSLMTGKVTDERKDIMGFAREVFGITKKT